ncbi:uncharacterized protein V6R79_010225 [Siganus canaliculatus]
MTKKNKTAVVSDGKSLAKITIFEAHTSRLTEGSSYILKGHSLRGHDPPYYLNICKQTTFFRGPGAVWHQPSAPQLHPTSALVHLRDYKLAHNFITVKADIQEISAIQRCKIGFDEVPMRRVVVKQNFLWDVIDFFKELDQFRQMEQFTSLRGADSSLLLSLLVLVGVGHNSSIMTRAVKHPTIAVRYKVEDFLEHLINGELSEHDSLDSGNEEDGEDSEIGGSGLFQ